MPFANVCLSPVLLAHYDISKSIVVIIDVLRATSTIVTALNNGAKYVVPVENVNECIKIGEKLNAITAGERDGKVLPGLKYGNSPSEYSKNKIENKILVITTTNGTRLLHLAKKQNAKEIVIGSFLNETALVEYLFSKNQSIMLACAGWKDSVNIEDMLFAGSIIEKIEKKFTVDCDSALISKEMYQLWQKKGESFLANTSHFKRLERLGLIEDIRLCFKSDTHPVVPIYKEGNLVLG